MDVKKEVDEVASVFSQPITEEEVHADLHTELILKAEYLEESVTDCTEGLPVAGCSTVIQETPGVEESVVIVVECKAEIKEENMDTEDPLSLKVNSNHIIVCPLSTFTIFFNISCLPNVISYLAENMIFAKISSSVFAFL